MADGAAVVNNNNLAQDSSRQQLLLLQGYAHFFFVCVSSGHPLAAVAKVALPPLLPLLLPASSLYLAC